MKILALDLATHTGFAHLDNGELLSSGAWDYTRAKGEHYGHMYRKLEANLNAFDVDAVAFEAAHHRGGAATRITTGMNAMVLKFAATNNLEVVSVHTMTLKKFATGSGKAKKPEMMVFASEKAGKEIIDDNEGDAIIVGFYALNQLKPDPF